MDHAPGWTDWLRLRASLLSVFLDKLRLGHPVDLGAEYVQDTQDHQDQIQSFIPVPDPFPLNRSHTAGELNLLALTQELQKKFLIESSGLRSKVDRAGLTRLNPQLVCQLLLVMRNVRLEKAAMGLR